MDVPALRAALAADPACEHAGLLVLLGSRARGDAGPGADWDVGYLADGDVDAAGLLVRLTELTACDDVDLVDLSRASGLLRFRAARDGIALLESHPDAFLAFRLAAVEFWCDAGTVIRAAQSDVLASLP